MEELKRNIDELIVKHLLDETTLDEKEFLLDWLKKENANQQYYFTFKEIWETSQITQNPIATEDSWKKLDSTIRNHSLQTGSGKTSSIWPSLLKIAAVATILAGLTIGFFKLKDRFITKKNVITYTMITTPNGQKKEIILPDGTKVWLNSGTEFKYPSTYGETNREVYLVGEAYFDVVKDKTKTFMVHTDKITIKVLGTSFNVKCYPELETIETTVITGIVSLENASADQNKDIVILNKREKATYVKDNKKMFISKNKTSGDLNAKVEPIGPKKISLNEEEANYIASWKDQTLYFNNETFEEMTMKLQRWFNVKIILSDKQLKEYRYKGKFENVHSIFQVLEVVKLTTPISYEYNEALKEITIKEVKN